MNNNDDIEILDDFDDELNEIFTEAQVSEVNAKGVNYNSLETNNENQIETLESIEEEKKETEIENPVVEMINNKTTMKLILVMLIVLFVAVLLMPQVFKLLK